MDKPMLLQHLIFVAIITVLPISAHFDIRKLKAESSTKAKLLTYLKMILLYWSITIAIFLAKPFEQIWFVPAALPDSWLIAVLFWFAALYFAVTTLLPMLLLSLRAFRAQVAAQFGKRSFVFPETGTERRAFLFVAVTVGICEEVIFRSFVWTYFQGPPFGWPLWTSFAAAVILFGAGHFLQGLSGIVHSTFVGLLLGFIFLYTGSLLLPVLIHILIDLKIILISWAASSARSRIDPVAASARKP